MWWLVPVTSVLRRLRQKDLEGFQVEPGSPTPTLLLLPYFIHLLDVGLPAAEEAAPAVRLPYYFLTCLLDVVWCLAYYV